ncbi:type II toxin-antitoxin system PemK/MazF family toxin [Dyadobacter luticola]|uniref:mRNA interferase n=1 Tax=Dyadobacter luticola TaxID=1979387 RepID=A0A5R9L759_9BACT|nr:type II toxin-antitoxin system PemK/MazF family toxin [Dyadobacter luticola]TLV04120.1 type II toxin-antitoxin system PemK/MazF family toxin [Dyadobacter luticola]
MVSEVRQYEIYWILLDPTIGSEIAKTRPCVVVSPNELNQFLRTVIIIPITSTIKSYPWRVFCFVAERAGSIAVDQMKVVDKTRISGRIGVLSKKEIDSLKETLKKMLVD